MFSQLIDLIVTVNHGVLQSRLHQFSLDGTQKKVPKLIFGKRSIGYGIDNIQKSLETVFYESFTHPAKPYMLNIFQPFKVGYSDTSCIQKHIWDQQYTPLCHYFVSFSRCGTVSCFSYDLRLYP